MKDLALTSVSSLLPRPVLWVQLMPTPGSGALPWPLRTSRALADRAAGVLAGLLARLHGLGNKIQFVKDRPDMAVFVIHDQDYWVWLEEHSLRSDYVLTAKEVAEEKLAEKKRRWSRYTV